MKQPKELPMLAGIAGFIRWIEELVNLLSGPLLTIGLGIALVDLLSDGALLTSLPILIYVWAATQAVGVDAQLVATWDRARIALREHRYWSLVGLVVLGAILAYVAWVAAQVFALQQSEGITTAQALQRLGMDAALWLIQRTALAVFLVCLAGWTRYHPPAQDVALDAQAEREKLQAELDLQPLRDRLRAEKTRGARGVLAAALGREETPPKPPTGGGTPAQKQPAQTGVITPAATNTSNVVPMTASRRRAQRRQVARNRVSVEAKARRAYEPGMSASALARTAHIGKSAASKWKGIIEAEQVKAVQ